MLCNSVRIRVGGFAGVGEGVKVCRTMEMNFRRHGRQFFFITLTLSGRVAVLSRLLGVDDAPLLLPPGEAVHSILRAIHPVFSYLTLSTYVIMPDHIHFILIANYDRSPFFNPMWFSFVLMEAIESSWAAASQGRAILSAEVLLKETAKKARARAREFDSWAGSVQRGETELPASLEKCASFPESPWHFDRRAYIELSFGTQQLKAIRRYIRLNPARAIWKREHSDRFQCLADFRHPVLDPACRWSAIGNLTLLASPFLFPVRLTMKKSAEAHKESIVAILECAKRGGIPVSGFISRGERELLRRLKAESRARFIKVLPYELPPRYDPSAEDSRELAADRLLLLSGLHDTPAIPSRDMRWDEASSHQFRQNCLDMNDLIAELCQRARTLTI